MLGYQKVDSGSTKMNHEWFKNIFVLKISNIVKHSGPAGDAGRCISTAAIRLKAQIYEGSIYGLNFKIFLPLP